VFQTFRKLADLLDPSERRRALAVLLVMLVVAAFETAGIASVLPFMTVVANPHIIQTNAVLSKLYRLVGSGSPDSFLTFLGGAVLVLIVGSLALKAYGFGIQVRFANMRNHSIGLRLVKSYLGQNYEWFLGRHTSDLSRIVLSEVSQVVHGALFNAMQIFAQAMAVLCIAVLLVLVDPLLAGAVAVSLGGAYGAILWISRKFIARAGRVREVTNRARFHVIQEMFGGIKEVKVMGLEAAFVKRFEEPSLQFARSNIAAKKMGELPSFAMQGLVFGGMMLVMIYLVESRQGLQGALPVLTLYAFAGYRLLPALQAMFSQASELRYSTAALNTLHADIQGLGLRHVPDFISQPNLATGRPEHRVNLRSRLELRDIDFTYGGSTRQILAKINLEIVANTTVGFVGTTGSGKTTTADLILGLLRPQAGALLVDGTQITSENVRAWRGNLGYVPQHIFLSDDSVSANIAFGVPKDLVDQAAVENAARIANLHDFVMRDLPQKYQTVVGERGVRLSGGQRQRIGIARALYHDPEVLILDEATSALDTLTETAVMEAVKNLGSRKTIIMIAHRLTTLESCDRIFFFEGGRVADSGTYGELMERSQQFRAMSKSKIA
jgi:ATP-binding cassette, subfamily B, bacterial PglK